MQPVRVSEFTVKSTGIKDLSVQGRAVRNMPYQEIAAKTYKNSKDQVLNVSLEKAGPIEVIQLVRRTQDKAYKQTKTRTNKRQTTHAPLNDRRI